MTEKQKFITEILKCTSASRKRLQEAQKREAQREYEDYINVYHSQEESTGRCATREKQDT
jgi:hypothetical protein